MSVASLAASPVDVGCLPAGARLAEELEALGRQLADVESDRLVGLLPAWERLVGWAQAGQLAVIAEVSRREHDPSLDPVPPGGQRMVPDPRQRVVAEVSAALGVSEGTGWRKLELSEALTERLPEVLDALAAGWLDLVRARVVVEESGKLPEEVARRVAARALTGIPPDETVAGWKERVRRLVAQRDPEAVRKPCRLSRADREVYLLQDQDGLATFGALLPEAEAGRVFAVVDLVARAALAADPADPAPEGEGGRRTLKQARADALVDLICNPATLPVLPTLPGLPTRPTLPTRPDLKPEPVQPPTLLTITVPFTALLDAAGSTDPAPATGETGEISGIGPVSGAAAAEAAVTALRGMAGGRVGIRWIGVDEPTGRAVVVTGTSYSPPRLLRAAVAARDRTCRFPGCRRTAEACDLDHVLPYPRGDTSEGNLASLCRHHHRMKTHARWRVRRGTHEELVWTSPHGATYRTHPATWTEPEPWEWAPPPAEPTDWTDSTPD